MGPGSFSEDDEVFENDFSSETECGSDSGNSYCTLADSSDFVPEIVTMAETKFYQIHHFNRQNYHLRKRQMEIYMTENGLKKYIDGSTAKPTVVADVAGWEKKGADA